MDKKVSTSTPVESSKIGLISANERSLTAASWKLSKTETVNTGNWSQDWEILGLFNYKSGQWNWFSGAGEREDNVNEQT
jgi:hypothetical protein